MLTLFWIAVGTAVVPLALTIADIVEDRRVSRKIANAALGAFSIRQ